MATCSECSKPGKHQLFYLDHDIWYCEEHYKRMACRTSQCNKDGKYQFFHLDHEIWLCEYCYYLSRYMMGCHWCGKDGKYKILFGGGIYWYCTEHYEEFKQRKTCSQCDKTGEYLINGEWVCETHKPVPPWLTERYIQNTIWYAAFPFSVFSYIDEPIKNPTEEEWHLANMFCPRLMVDPHLFERERKYLKKNLHNTNIREALFLFNAGLFPYDTSAAELFLLASLKDRISQGYNRYERLRCRPLWGEGPLHDLSKEYKRTSKKLIKARIKTLFNRVLPAESPTVVFKFQVKQHKERPDIYCIQYFAYWPIQLGLLLFGKFNTKILQHPFDYEPIYVYVIKIRKNLYEPILIVYNEDPGGLSRAIPFFKGKRPGHIIRTFINWGRETDLFPNYGPQEFNLMAEKMTQAYRGEYYYQKLEAKSSQDYLSSHIERLHVKEDSDLGIAFHIPSTWHGFKPAMAKVCKKWNQKGWKSILPRLDPLKNQDLPHIGWSTTYPFHAPFLYPTAGGKNPLMHFQLDLSTLVEQRKVHDWYEFAEYILEEPIQLTFSHKESVLDKIEMQCELLARLRFWDSLRESDELQ